MSTAGLDQPPPPDVMPQGPPSITGTTSAPDQTLSSNVTQQTALSTAGTTSASAEPLPSDVAQAIPISTAGALISTTFSASVSLALPTAPDSPLLQGCGAVSVYYGQKQQDWVAHNLDAWLNTWVGKHGAEIAANAAGFTGAFASWAVGNPNFDCRDDGSKSDCDFNPCDIATLNSKGPEIREAYYVMESLNRIHTYFMGLREGFTVSAIASALSKDDWASTFYRDKDVKQVTALREVLNALAMVVGIGAAFAGLGGAAVGAIAGAASAMFAGGVGATLPLIGQHADDTFSKAADLGGLLGQVVLEAIKGFTSANNILMAGKNYLGTGDLRDYFKGGAFVAYPGVDKNAVTDAMSGFLIGHAVNQLWRKQKIFILGGGACGDNQGIGSGPAENSICRDGKAWYLYYWQENGRFTLSMRRWGWVAGPPGADALGKGAYTAVKVTDVINSSLDAYLAAGYNYNKDTALARAQSALKDQWANPGARGPSWEGIFTIPVCDISATIESDFHLKERILMPYNSDDHRLVWCGAICSGDLDKTKEFIRAANMENFQSPKRKCLDDPEY